MVLALVAPSTALAFADGNEMKAAFDAGPNTYTAALTYVRGVIDGLGPGWIMAKASSGNTNVTVADIDEGLGYCVPRTATNQQNGDVVRAYLEAHPAQRHNHAPLLIIRALRQAYPCQK